MQTETRYSLVVMTRNRPGPLERCLASIERLRWDGDRPEVILVDDGSDSPAGRISADFQSLRIVNVRLEHLGVAAARNAGIEHSTGACVAFIADDYALPESYLSDIDRFFRAHPEAQVISHNIRPRGALLFQPVQQLYFDLAIGQAVPPGQTGREVVFSYSLPASRAAMFRREVFDRVGRFNERLLVGEDGEFGQRMARCGIPVYLFSHKRVDHFDARGSLDYFRQRLRYGRSYVRSGVSGLPLASMSRPAFIAKMLSMLKNKCRLWWQVSGRMGSRRQYLLLSPFLVLFLCFFYYGAYEEFCELRKAGLDDLPAV